MKMNTLKTGILLLAASATIVSCKKEGPTVTADKTTVEVGELVSLNCLAADEALKTSYVTWDFGDGDDKQNVNSTDLIYNNNNPLVVSHAYAKAGTYTVAAIVNKSKNPTKKNAKTSMYGSTTITVVAAKAEFTASKESGIKLGERVALSNTTTSNGKKLDAYSGSNITFAWSCKNSATGAADGNFGAATNDQDNTIMFASAGTYIVTLKTFQGDSKSEITKTLTVGATGEINPESTVDGLLGAHSSLGVSASYAVSATNVCASSQTPTSLSFSNTTFKKNASSENSFDVYGVITGEGDQLNGELLMTVTLDAKGTAWISNKYNSSGSSTASAAINSLFNLLPAGEYQYSSTGLKYKYTSQEKCTWSSPAVEYTTTKDASITW